MIAHALDGTPVDRDTARAMLTDDARFPLLPLAHAAGVVRRHHYGNRVQVHVLNNVQNGACPEDCGYCGQAKTSDAPIAAYKLKSREEIIDEAEQAARSGAFRYCMVLSGRGPSDSDIDHMADCIREVKERFGIETCLSSGLLDEPKAQRLKEAGLDRLNHNINTSEGHYPSICTTHTYGDRMATLKAARSAGLSLCSGMIVGMGERVDDIIEVAAAASGLGIESIPVNFLVPIPGNDVVTPHIADADLSPAFCVRVLSMFRFMNPEAELRVAAGREGHLRSLQALAMEPANSLFVDGYLLTRGSGPVPTLRMLRDAGFDIHLEGSEWNDDVRDLITDGRLDDFAIPDITSDLGVLREEKVSERKLAKLTVQGGESG